MTHSHQGFDIIDPVTYNSPLGSTLIGAPCVAISYNGPSGRYNEQCGCRGDFPEETTWRRTDLERWEAPANVVHIQPITVMRRRINEKGFWDEETE